MSLNNLSAFDITIIFQKASEFVPGQIGIMDQVSVTFSPQHFKAFVKSLSETLQAYEASYGALTISDADTAPIRNAAEIAMMIQAAKAKQHSNPSSSEPKPRAKQSRSAAPK